MDKDVNLIAYDVTYEVEPGSVCILTRTETRRHHVGLMRYVKDTEQWEARYRFEESGDPSEFPTIDEARSYLVQRYEAENGWKGNA